MSQTRSAAKKFLPTAGVTAAGVTAGAAGIWAWRRRRNPPVETSTPSSVEVPVVAEDEPAAPMKMKRNGPMVAVYLDETSVDKLRREFPGVARGRLRKVVVQHSPSDEERAKYDPYFGNLATVKLTGEAFSANRRALMASVSHGENSVEPQSLSCAVDVTPGEVGGGPLGSAALIEQIKRAGAAKEGSWKGTLPSLSANEREFPPEEGGFDKLDEPMTLSGCICRADWIEGNSGRCRTLTEEGTRRTDGWTPQACIICNILEASPCRDVYKRFDSVCRRISALEPPKEPPASADESSQNISGDGGGDGGVAEKRETGGSVDLSAADSTVDKGESGMPSPAPTANVEGYALAGEGNTSAEERKEQTERSGDVAVEGEGEGSGEAKNEVESEEDKTRREELEKLEAEREQAAFDMLHCTEYHSVWDDSNADDGTVPIMGDDDDGDEGKGGESTSEGEVPSGGEEQGKVATTRSEGTVKGDSIGEGVHQEAEAEDGLREKGSGDKESGVSEGDTEGDTRAV